MSLQKLGLCLLLFSLCGCTLITETKETVLSYASDFVPDAAIEALDTQSWNVTKARLKIVSDTRASKLLEELAQPLVNAATEMGAPRFQWDFHLVDSADLNAFALPGGTIAVNTGLIEYSDTGLELVGVLGHEVAHVLAKHGVKSMILHSGASLLLSMLMGDLGQISGIAIEKLTGLGLLKFSRDHEREADTLGAQILERAKYPSIGLQLFFNALHQNQSNTGTKRSEPNTNETKQSETNVPDWAQKGLSLLSTHPMSAERARNIEALAARNEIRTLNKKTHEVFSQLRVLIKQQ